MKRIASLVAVMLALAGAAPAALASADWSPGFYVRGAFGFTAQRQGDLNDLIKSDEQFLQSFGLPVGFDKFGGTPEYGGEVGFRFREVLSLGVSVLHQRTTVQNGYADASGAYSDRMRATLTEITANLTFWPASAPGLFLGAQAGGGFGEFTEHLTLTDYTDPTNDADLRGKWTGSGAVFGIFTGYQTELSGPAFLFGRVGYRFRNLGKFDGDFTDALTGDTSSGAYQNNAGTPVEFDFSGVHVTAGIGVNLGGGR